MQFLSIGIIYYIYKKRYQNQETLTGDLWIDYQLLVLLTSEPDQKQS